MAFRRPVGIGSVFLVAFVGLAGACLGPACLIPERPPSDSQGAPGGGVPLGEADGGPGDGGGRDGALADSGAALCAPPTFVDGVTFARNVYVASTGDDANDGLTREKPWRSLRNTSKLKPGDNVEISPGSYPCSVRLTVAGTASAPVWIHGVLNQAPPTFDCSADEFGVRMEGASYVAVENLAFRASPRDLLVVDRTQDATLRSSHHVLVRRTVLSEFGGSALRVVGASDVDVRESTFRGPAALGGGTDRGGVVTLGSQTVLILGNRFDEFGAVPGVVARAGSSNVIVDANRFAGVGTVMSLGGTSSPVDFVRDTDDFEGNNLAFLNNLVTGAVDDVFLLAGCVDCFIVNNTISARGAASLVRSFRGAVGTARGAGFSLSKRLSLYNNIVEFLSVPVRMLNMATEDSVGLRLSHSLLRAVGTTVSAVASAPPVAGERIVLDVDPRFVAPEAGDFRLQPSSPAAGAGVAVSLVKRNGQGQCRTEWNMGAF